MCGVEDSKIEEALARGERKIRVFFFWLWYLRTDELYSNQFRGAIYLAGS